MDQLYANRKTGSRSPSWGTIGLSLLALFILYFIGGAVLPGLHQRGLLSSSSATYKVLDKAYRPLGVACEKSPQFRNFFRRCAEMCGYRSDTEK